MIALFPGCHEVCLSVKMETQVLSPQVLVSLKISIHSMGAVYGICWPVESRVLHTGAEFLRKDGAVV